MVASELDFARGCNAIPWRALFLAFDADKDGKLGPGEIVKGVRQLCEESSTPNAVQINDERLNAVEQALDIDYTGAVEWSEWLALSLLDLGGEPLALLSPELLVSAARLISRPLGIGMLTFRDLQICPGQSNDELTALAVGELQRALEEVNALQTL